MPTSTAALSHFEDPAPADPTDAADNASPLVQIIELKWLLTGMGVHLHVERLQHDAAYAREQLDRAAQSTNPALRKAAARLAQKLLPPG